MGGRAGRKKAISDEQLIEPVLVPAVRTSRGGHAHDLDPYAPPPGAVPGRSKELATTAAVPIKRKMTKEDIAARDEARRVMKMRAARYERYLDALVEFGGDQEQALADVYGLPREEVRLRRVELHADVKSGIGSSELSEVLERNDLALASRVAVLRKHAFSANPAASLKALDMVSEMEGTRGDVGSFESYLRLAKEQGAKR